MQDDDEILATIAASPPRRWLGLVCHYILGFMSIYIALAASPGFAWQMFLLVLGGGVLWQSEKMRSGSALVIELTRSGLRDSAGAHIASVDEIAQVESGLFSFKPPNGFLIRTKTPTGPRAWRPGLWWRTGRRIGIGGVTSASQTKNVVQILAVLMAERDQL